jgi:hypothetical protein
MSRISRVRFRLLLIFPAVTPAQTAATGKPEDQIRQLEKDRFAAMIKVDEAAMNRLIGDDVVYVHSTANLQNKKEFIEMLKAGTVHYISLVPSDPTSRCASSAMWRW